MSLDMYLMLCQRLGVFSNFLDVLSGFGAKTTEVQEEPPVFGQKFRYTSDDTPTPQGCGKYQTILRDDLLNFVKR